MEWAQLPYMFSQNGLNWTLLASFPDAWDTKREPKPWLWPKCYGNKQSSRLLGITYSTVHMPTEHLHKKPHFQPGSPTITKHLGD
jgi:hypothetical protein